MGPTRWTAEKNEALLTAIGQTILKSATPAQKTSIEEHLKENGFESTTWEAIRYVIISCFVLSFAVELALDTTALLLLLLLLFCDDNTTPALAGDDCCLVVCSEPISACVHSTTDEGTYHRVATLSHIWVR